MTHISAALRDALTRFPMPTLSDGSGLMAEWGAGIRPDGSWGVYTLNDGRTATWAAIPCRDSREAIAVSRMMNGRAQLTDEDDRRRRDGATIPTDADPLWERYLAGDR